MFKEHWYYILDHQRIPSTSDPVIVGAAQLTALLPLLDVRPLVLLDRYYSRAPWLHATAHLPLDQFIRARVPLDPCGPPDATICVTEAAGRTTEVAVWHHLPIRKARAVELSVVRITTAFYRSVQRFFSFWLRKSPRSSRSAGTRC